MFRLLFLVFLGICVLDMVLAAFETRRVWFMWGSFIERLTNPLGYWFMTALWSATAAIAVAGIPVLLYHAFNSSGPYKEHGFFSFHQAWPFGIFALVTGWLAVMIIRDRLQQFKDRNHGPAA